MSKYQIHERIEAARGCGYRKPGGKYLVAGGVGMPCGKLPLELTVCPCCSAGIKPSRGWTWVDADRLGVTAECVREDSYCLGCPLSGKMGRAGLLWVGQSFYATPGHWTAEAMKMGISRRLHQIPNEFEVGKTWVLMAHQKAIQRACSFCRGRGLCMKCDGMNIEYANGIFHAFKPTAIEYVLTEQESEDELRKLQKRGFTLVRVKRDDGKPLGSPAGAEEEE